MDEVCRDERLAYKMRALEMYNNIRALDAQRQTNNRSLMLAAAGVIGLIGGAAVSASETPVTSIVGCVMAMCGCIVELCGLIAFMRSV